MKGVIQKVKYFFFYLLDFKILEKKLHKGNFEKNHLKFGDVEYEIERKKKKNLDKNALAIFF